jgi:hypothetical protein
VTEALEVTVYFNLFKYIFTTLSNPRYKDSEIRACPIETSNKFGILSLKNLILSKLKSCPALIPKPISFALIAALTNGSIAV